jgi:integrase/recombinase XerD
MPTTFQGGRSHYQYKREPLDSIESDKFANACESHDEKLVGWVLLDTGLRVSEFANLTPQNVQWQEGRLMVYGKGGPYGKMSNRRVIPLTERAKRLLEVHFATHNKIGMTSRTVERVVKRIANKAGISKPVSPHVLRHTFAVTCIKKGISTRALQEFLGHDRLATTEIYLNLSPEEAMAEFKRKW